MEGIFYQTIFLFYYRFKPNIFPDINFFRKSDDLSTNKIKLKIKGVGICLNILIKVKLELQIFSDVCFK